MVKKVLIMSASTGGGHNRAAKAIKEDLESRFINGARVECEIIDSLKLVNITMDRIISRGYEKSAIYTPKAYGTVYNLSETNIASRNEFKVNPLTSLMVRKFKHLITDRNPDFIIGTHPFPMIALSKLKKGSDGTISHLYKSTNSPIIPPMMSILTDYTTHSTWIQNEIDYYVVGNEFVKELLVEDDVEQDKIFPYGIPVEKSFLIHRSKDIVLSELNLDPNKFTVLLMGGSFGAGNMKETFDELLSIDRDFQIVVVTGKNVSLKEKLSKSLLNHHTNKKVSILGYTDKMNDILSSVDLLITKPGGLTTTEALLKSVPMVIPYFIPGQEEENLDFFTNYGCAIKITKKFTLPVAIKVLFDNPHRIEVMKRNMNTIQKPNSAKDICDLAINGIFKHEKNLL